MLCKTSVAINCTVEKKQNIMNLEGVLLELQKMGSEQTKKVLSRHGAREPFYGVKVGDMKKIVSKIKKNRKLDPAAYPQDLHELALELYQTGISDAMYLAGLIADPRQFTLETLEDWVKKADWYMISDYTVAGMAAESRFAWDLGLKWIESLDEFIASAGWATLSGFLSICDNRDLDQQKLEELLGRIPKEIHSSPNRVRYSMNNFIIALGSFVPDFTDRAKKVGILIGDVDVDMGGTACKVPRIEEYLNKVENKGYLGRKKARVIC